MFPLLNSYHNLTTLKIFPKFLQARVILLNLSQIEFLRYCSLVPTIGDKCSTVEAFLPGLTSTLRSIVDQIPSVVYPVKKTCFRGYDNVKEKEIPIRKHFLV